MFGSASIRRSLLLVLFAALLVYLVGNEAIGLWDRDEPRYAQCSREMLKGSAENPGSDFVVPRFLGDLRPHKPPLIYWAQAGAMLLFGDNAFAARFPSTLAILLTAVILAITIGRVIGHRRAFWTVLVFCSSLAVIATAKMCITDATLLLWVTIIHLCLYAIRRGWGNWKVVGIMWIAVGLGGLTKGPSVIIMPLLTMIILAWMETWGRITHEVSTIFAIQLPAPPSVIIIPLPKTSAVLRFFLTFGRMFTSPRQWFQSIAWWKYTNPLLGLIILAAICVPWIVLVTKRAPDFILLLLGQAVMHSGTAMEQHKGPPGYYLITIWGTFFPWSLILPTAITVALCHRRSPAIQFAIAATIGPWLFWELIKTKLPHYVLPIFPPLAFLTADAIVRCIRKQHDDMHQRRFVIASAIVGLIAIGLCLAPWAPLLYQQWVTSTGTPPSTDLDRILSAMDVPRWGAAALSASAILVAVVVFIAFQRRAIARACLAMGFGALLIMFVAGVAYLPNLKFLQFSRQVANSLRRQGATLPGQEIMIDYKEPSLAFYQGGTIREANAPGNINQIRNWPRWVVITEPTWKAQPPEAHSLYREIDAIAGCAYANRGRWVKVLVLERIAP